MSLTEQEYNSLNQNDRIEYQIMKIRTDRIVLITYNIIIAFFFLTFAHIDLIAQSSFNLLFDIVGVIFFGGYSFYLLKKQVRLYKQIEEDFRNKLNLNKGDE